MKNGIFLWGFLIGLFSFTAGRGQGNEAGTTNAATVKQEDAEKDKTSEVKTPVTYSLSAYVDVYYAHYTDSVGPGSFQKFGTVSPRNNTPSLNTAQLSFQYNADKIRTMVALHYGDIASSSWSSTYNNVMEAHVGIRLLKKLWIDGGFFRTHYGTEYLLPVENITSSVTVSTYYEPYYESGLRLDYNPTDKLMIDLYMVNGYGIFIDNNNKKSFAAAITYSINDKTGIGYTNYIGDDTPPGNDTTHLRIHQNLFLNYKYKKFRLQVSGDYCLQENSDIATHNKMARLYSGLLTMRYQLPATFAIYGRGEVFNDPDAIVSNLITDRAGKLTGYELWGVTAGAEYKPTANSYVRLEGRMLQMNQYQDIFYYNGTQQNYRYEIMINAGINFDLISVCPERHN